MRLVTLLIPALLTACGGDIPVVTDPHDIHVAGHAMTQNAFLLRYCQGNLVHPSCIAVSRARAQDATRGAMPKGW